METKYSILENESQDAGRADWTAEVTAPASSLKKRLAFGKYVGCIGKTKPYVVVTVARRVVVAIRYTQVGRVVVPRATATNTVGASRLLYHSLDVTHFLRNWSVSPKFSAAQ